MIDESMNRLPEKSSRTTDRPFRLIVHIGSGKTGTSSIQKTLRTQQEELKRRGFWYLGYILENAPVKFYHWQKNTGNEEFLLMDRKSCTEQFQQVLSRSLPIIKKAGCHAAICSNEAFWLRNAAIIDALAAMPEVEVRIIAYVRRHDAWARSAYIQWGLKHKTYRGPVQSFASWLKTNGVDFHRHLRPWLERFPGCCEVRNFDTVGDVVEDFLEVVGIGGAGLKKLRIYETPSPEELVLRTLFNEQSKDKVPAFKFNKILTGDDIRFDRPIDRILDAYLPTEEEVKQVAVECAGDRTAINAILANGGQPPLVETPLSAKSMAIEPAKLTTAIVQIIVHQAKKINELEVYMENLKPATATSQAGQTSVSSLVRTEKRPAKACDTPVFAISTGRSGSTLVQRALNCHPDLVLWGEHHGFLNGLASVHGLMSSPGRVRFPQTAADNKGPGLLLPTLSNPDAGLEWANPWSLEEFEAKLRVFLDDYFGSRLAPGQRWGFKEIRYNNMPALNMLRFLYPKGKFVFIKRDLIEVTRSKVFAFIKESNWQEMPEAKQRQRVEGMLKDVREHYRVYETFLKRHPAVGLVVHYEELVATPRDVIAAMLKHLALDPTRYDWGLAEQVMASIITSTKRDEALVEFIREVDASWRPEKP